MRRNDVDLEGRAFLASKCAEAAECIVSNVADELFAFRNRIEQGGDACEIASELLFLLDEHDRSLFTAGEMMRAAQSYIADEWGRR